MILFSILSFMIIAIIFIAAIIALICGAGFVMVFGDAIVCGLLIWILIKLFILMRKSS